MSVASTLPRWAQQSHVSDGERLLFGVVQYDPCAYCGRRGDYWRSLMTLDHVTPRSHGGDDAWMNITASCFRCNSSKCDADLLSAMLAGFPAP